MKEIKFRAWDKEVGKMYQNVGLVGNTIVLEYEQDEDEHDFEMDYWCDKRCEDVFIMQWTGLFDKQGRSIYEGDIVTYTETTLGGYNDVTGLVKYFECAYWIDDKKRSFANPLFSETAELEIIGNIYENPELIEGETKQ